jgi:hypothetical protein
MKKAVNTPPGDEESCKYPTDYGPPQGKICDKRK